MMAFLGRLIAPYVARLLAWGAIALAVLSAIGGAILLIRRDAVSAYKDKQAEQTIERVKDARQIEDDVAGSSSDDVSRRLREWNRD